MKLNLIGGVMLIAAITMIAVPVWGQDAAASKDRPAGARGGISPAAASEAVSAVRIEDAVVCQDVIDRTPVGANDMFVQETPKVYCFCRVVGAQAGSRITHNWYYNGVLKASVKLNVGSSDYRTWSSKTLHPGWEGEWMVEILSDDGKPLDSIVFIIK